MRYFCTYFDSGYLPRALALHESLSKYAGQFKLWVLCFDDETYSVLNGLNLDGIIPIKLEEFEDDQLRAARSNRSRVEYYFTCTPSLVLHVLKNNPGVDLLYYVDADLVFFSSPAAIEEDLGDNSIYIVGHRYSKRAAVFEKSGIYNVGLVGFRNDANSLQCASWWREKCLEWCHDYLDGDRFADQKYLDQWPALFAGVKVAEHPGVGVGPWNLESADITLKGDVLHVGAKPLVFFHYHAFRRLWRHLYDPHIGPYGVSMNRTVRGEIFCAYVQALYRAETKLASTGATAALTSGQKVRKRKNMSLGQRVMGNLSSLLWLYRNFVMRRLVWCKTH